MAPTFRQPAINYHNYHNHLSVQSMSRLKCTFGRIGGGGTRRQDQPPPSFITNTTNKMNKTKEGLCYHSHGRSLEPL